MLEEYRLGRYEAMATITITKKEYEQLKTMVGKIPKVAKEVIHHIEEKEQLQKENEEYKEVLGIIFGDGCTKGQAKLCAERSQVELQKDLGSYKAIAEEKIKENEKLKKDLEHAKETIIMWIKMSQKADEKYKKLKEENEELKNDLHDAKDTMGDMFKGWSESRGKCEELKKELAETEKILVEKDIDAYEESEDEEESEVEYDCGCCYAERQNSYIMGNDDLDEEHYICEKCFDEFCSKEQHPIYNGKNGWTYLMDKDN